MVCWCSGSDGAGDDLELSQRDGEEYAPRINSLKMPCASIYDSPLEYPIIKAAKTYIQNALKYPSKANLPIAVS